MDNLDIDDKLACMPQNHLEHNNRWMGDLRSDMVPIRMTVGNSDAANWFPGLGAMGGMAGGFLDTAAPVGITSVERAANLVKDGANRMFVGMGASAVVTGFDEIVRNEVGTHLGGHDFFRPTRFEQFGIGLAASAPIDPKLRWGLAGVSWLSGRVENYFYP
jgi:hypothetical protein